MVKGLRVATAAAAIGAGFLSAHVAEGWQGAGIGRNQLIGSWGSVAQGCAAEGRLSFRADGRYASAVGGGRWTLRGNRLSLTNWGGGNNVPVELRRNGTLVIRWTYGPETFRRC